MEFRIKFERLDEVKYISHLDMMKVFERAIRRAKIKVSCSKGFNPHPQIIFGIPMGVGVTGLCEYAGIRLDEELSSEELIKKINDAFPVGFKVIEARPKVSKGNIMSQIGAATYDVDVFPEDDTEGEMILEKLPQFMAKDEIMTIKEGKNGRKNVEIRSLILEMNVLRNRNGYKFKMLLRAGQPANLRPELVINAFNEFTSLQLKIQRIARTAIYAIVDGKLTNPMDLI